MCQNLILKLLLFIMEANQKCNHENVPINVDEAYCPTCGKLIKNEWYITRCKCCGIKLKSKIKNNEEISPYFQYCTNCGSEEFIIEKLDSINFINVNFAVLKKSVDNSEPTKTYKTTQCWQEKTCEPLKLLTQCQ